MVIMELFPGIYGNCWYSGNATATLDMICHWLEITREFLVVCCCQYIALVAVAIVAVSHQWNNDASEFIREFLVPGCCHYGNCCCRSSVIYLAIASVTHKTVKLDRVLKLQNAALGIISLSHYSARTNPIISSWHSGHGSVCLYVVYNYKLVVQSQNNWLHF